jgi:alpha-D-xyloside xylohydrolase
VFVRPGAVIPFYPEDVDCTDDMDMSKATSIVVDEEFKGIWR